MLTAALLREAATYLGPTYLHGDRFMCFAVSSALRDRPWMEAEAISSQFYRLLQAHDVSTSGNLFHQDTRYVTNPTRTQRLRFDFLNLLACSLEKP